MKVKVIREFIDRHTGKLHLVGDTLEITDERYAEIGKSGKFVEVQPDSTPAESVSPVSEPKKRTTRKKKGE